MSKYQRCIGLISLVVSLSAAPAWAAGVGGLKFNIPWGVDLAMTDCYESIKIQDPATGKIIYSNFKELIERDEVIRLGAGDYRVIIDGCEDRVAFTQNVHIVADQLTELLTGYYYNFSSEPVMFQGFPIPHGKSFLVWRSASEPLLQWYARPGTSVVEVPRDYALGAYGMNEYVQDATHAVCNSYMVFGFFLVEPGQPLQQLRLNNIPVALDRSDIPGVTGKLRAGTAKLEATDGATIRIYDQNNNPVKLAKYCMDVILSGEDLPYSLQIQLPIGHYRAESMGIIKEFNIKKDETTWVGF